MKSSTITLALLALTYSSTAQTLKIEHHNKKIEVKKKNGRYHIKWPKLLTYKKHVQTHGNDYLTKDYYCKDTQEMIKEYKIDFRDQLEQVLTLPFSITFKNEIFPIEKIKNSISSQTEDKKPTLYNVPTPKDISILIKRNSQVLTNEDEYQEFKSSMENSIKANHYNSKSGHFTFSTNRINLFCDIYNKNITFEYIYSIKEEIVTNRKQKITNNELKSLNETILNNKSFNKELKNYSYRDRVILNAAHLADASKKVLPKEKNELEKDDFLEVFHTLFTYNEAYPHKLTKEELTITTRKLEEVETKTIEKSILVVEGEKNVF